MLQPLSQLIKKSLIKSNFGNSRLFRGLDTPLLNQMSSESGCGLRFYNAGFPGMSAVELINNLDSLSANQSFKPDYVLFMPSAFRTQTNLVSQRRRNNALIRLWRIQMLSLHANNRGFRSYKNLHLSMLERGFNKSKLTRKLFFNDIPQKVSLSNSLLIQSNAGYLSLDEDPRYGLDNRRHLKFKNTPELYQAVVLQLSSAMQLGGSNEPPGAVSYEGGISSLNTSAKTLLDLFVNKIKSLEAEPITLFFPQDSGLPERGYYRDNFPNIKQVVASNDEISQFINKDLWYDDSHLKRAGAELFTKIVYRQMCPSTGN